MKAPAKCTRWSWAKRSPGTPHLARRSRSVAKRARPLIGVMFLTREENRAGPSRAFKLAESADDVVGELPLTWLAAVDLECQIVSNWPHSLLAPINDASPAPLKSKVPICFRLQRWYVDCPE